MGLNTPRTNGLERIPTNPAIERGVLATRIQNERTRHWRAVPMEDHDASIDHMFGKGMLNRLKGFHAQAGPAVDAAERDLMPALVKLADDREIERNQRIASGEMEEANETDDRASIAALGRIVARLRMPPPQEVGDELDEEHAYLMMDETDRLQRDPDNLDEDEKLIMYKVRDNVVLEDIAALRSFVKTFGRDSVAGKAAQNLIEQLHAYRMLDAKVAAHQRSDDLFGSRSMMDVKGKLMGRTLLFGLCAAAAVVFGSASAVQYFKTGKISWVPAGYALAALLFLSPGKIINTLFDKDDPMKQEFAEARRVSQNPMLLALCTRYGIGGEGWADVIDGIYNGDHGNIAKTARPTSGAVDTAVDALASGNPMVAQRLRMMFNAPKGINGKNDFQRLVEALGAAKSDGAKELAVNSVRSNFFVEAPYAEIARAQIHLAKVEAGGI